MAQKRILLITYGELSGVNKSIADALRRQGCDVLVVSHKIRNLRYWRVYVLGMVVSAVRYYGSGCRKYLHFTPFSNRVHSRLNESIARQYMPVDAVISTGSLFNNHRHNKLPGVKYAMLTDHVNRLSKQLPDYGYKANERGKHTQWNDVEGYVLRSQDHNFVFARYVREAMINDYGVAPDRVTTVGAGPNIDLDAGRDKITKDYSRQQVLFVGIEAERKGLPILLQAFSRITDDFPRSCLHIAGVEGDSHERVIYYGRLGESRLRDLFYETQYFVLPSLREPFGIVLLEAMWSRSVCIGSSLGATPEIIVNSVSGCTIRPGDVDELENTFRRLFSQPGWARQLADAGYRTARERYSWDRAAEVITDTLFGQALR